MASNFANKKKFLPTNSPDGRGCIEDTSPKFVGRNINKWLGGTHNGGGRPAADFHHGLNGTLETRETLAIVSEDFELSLY